MKARILYTALFLMTFVSGTFAQGERVSVKITDLKNVTTTLTNATTSSSSSCNTSDFPVYQGSTLKEVNLADLTWISVRHDLNSSDPNNYVSVELTFKDGKSAVYEMVKHIRFSGRDAEGNNVNIKVLDINTVQIVQKI
jgi:hypothetical protein